MLIILIFQFWQQHNQPIVLDNNFLIDQKVEYIHNNPVEAGFVEKPEDWRNIVAQLIFTINGKLVGFGLCIM
ncbi:MAG: hypothetical protein IPJ31_07525 [Bacteroidetes bacterium]|nr:hypothetical protein [Bacteroidota bacterium]